PAPAPRAPPAKAAPGQWPTKPPMPAPSRPPAAAPVPAPVSQPPLAARAVSKPTTHSVRRQPNACGLRRTTIEQLLLLPEDAAGRRRVGREAPDHARQRRG